MAFPEIDQNNPRAIRLWLDRKILTAYQRKMIAETNGDLPVRDEADHYIGAYQTVRKALFGSEASICESMAQVDHINA